MCRRDVRDVTAVLRVLLVVHGGGPVWLWLVVWALVGPAVRAVADSAAEARAVREVEVSRRRHPSMWEANGGR